MDGLRSYGKATGRTRSVNPCGWLVTAGLLLAGACQAQSATVTPPPGPARVGGKVLGGQIRVTASIPEFREAVLARGGQLSLAGLTPLPANGLQEYVIPKALCVLVRANCDYRLQVAGTWTFPPHYQVELRQEGQQKTTRIHSGSPLDVPLSGQVLTPGEHYVNFDLICRVQPPFEPPSDQQINFTARLLAPTGK